METHYKMIIMHVMVMKMLWNGHGYLVMLLCFDKFQWSLASGYGSLVMSTRYVKTLGRYKGQEVKRVYVSADFLEKVHIVKQDGGHVGGSYSGDDQVHTEDIDGDMVDTVKAHMKEVYGKQDIVTWIGDM